MAETRGRLGILLIVFGIIGIVTGVVPLVINGLRIVADEDLWNTVDTAAHGVEAMGLSVEWAMLSSAMGTCLGIFLVWAGRAWRAGMPEARPVTWCYVICGLLVNGTDMAIFVFQTRQGPMRTTMLFFDGIALAIPVVLGVWLMRNRGAATPGKG